MKPSPEFTNETLPGVWNFTLTRTVFFTYSLLHSKASFYSASHKSNVPSAQVFQCEQKHSHHKMIANYLTKQSFCHYLCVTKEESVTLREKSNARGHLSQWLFLHLHPWEMMLSIILHKSPFGVTLTDMQACICRTRIIWQWVTADIWPHHQ